MVKYTSQLISESAGANSDIHKLHLNIDPTLSKYIGEKSLCLTDIEFANKSIKSASLGCSDILSKSFFQSSLSNSKNEHFFHWQHDDLFLLPSNTTIKGATEIAQTRAEELYRSIIYQSKFDNNWAGRTRPFLIGGGTTDDIVDFNGALNPGVTILNPVAKTLFGMKMPLAHGDKIVTLNGTKVFGTRDFYYLLNQHGLSRDKGIEAPLKLGIVTSEGVKTVETTYFFNEHHTSYAGDQSAIAFWYGVGDAISFGQTPWTLCNGNNLLRGVGNVLSATFEWVGSMVEKRTFDSRTWNTVSYIDAKECSWQMTQARALGQQKEEEVYLNSQWLGIFTPGAVRMVGAKATRQVAVRAFGKGILSRGFADASLEVVETTIWSLGTAAPGVSLNARFGDAAAVAPWAAAAGFVSGAITASK